jgi:hypothetical protein
MGIHDESTYSKRTALEAEMSRRLWWSLAIFDHQVCEMLDDKSSALNPGWDCRIPLNVDDSELRPQMKSLPASHERPTEAIFAIVCWALGDSRRRRASSVSVGEQPSKKTLKSKGNRHRFGPGGDELSAQEAMIEEKYIAFCDPENPLHYMTIWTTRGYLAKNRLLEHYSKHSTSSLQQTDVQRNSSMLHALNMLECDTTLMDSPLTKGYMWLIRLDFPFFAYVHVLQDLKRRPTEYFADRAWDALTQNYLARTVGSKQGESIFIIFSRGVLQAWEARKTAFGQQGNTRSSLEPPEIVSVIQSKFVQLSGKLVQGRQVEQQQCNIGIVDPSLPPDMDHAGYGNEWQYASGLDSGLFANLPVQDVMDIMDININEFWAFGDGS